MVNFYLRLILSQYIEWMAGIEVGDILVIDGGMASFEVIEKVGNDLRCQCTDSGLFLPRAKFSFWRDGKLVARNNELPTLSKKVQFILIVGLILELFLDTVAVCLSLLTHRISSGIILDFTLTNLS